MSSYARRDRRVADSEPEPGAGLGVSPYRSKSVIERVFYNERSERGTVLHN